MCILSLAIYHVVIRLDDGWVAIDLLQRRLFLSTVNALRFAGPNVALFEEILVVLCDSLTIEAINRTHRFSQACRNTVLAERISCQR